MMLRLRVELADRPGSLADLTRCLATAGGDVAQITVMQRTEDEAIDDVWVGVADVDVAEWIRSAVMALPNARLLGLRICALPVEFDAQLDFLAYLFAAPQRGAEAFVEMLPSVVDADWAAIRSPSGELLYDSGGRFGETTAAGGHTGDAVADLPMHGGARLLVGRAGGLAWHPAEIRRLAGMLELGALLIRQYEQPRRYPVTPLTGWFPAEALTG
jgi:hypothetical protein